MNHPSVSVVIPNYNGERLLPETLPPLYAALRRANVEYEIIVVDDASTDRSVPFLRREFPAISVLQNERNLGFSPTINKGLMAARKELVFAMNSDVYLEEGYFLPLFRHFGDADTFGVTGRIIGVRDDRIQDAAKHPGNNPLVLGTNENFVVTEPDGFPTPTLFMSGANALMDRKKVQLLRGYDEAFAPFYREDVELTLRAWRLGWKSYYEHAAVCRHQTSQTIAAHHRRRFIRVVSRKNKLILHYLHLDGVYKLVWWAKLALDLLFRWVYGDQTFYAGFGLFVRQWRQVQVSRKNFRDLRRKNGFSLSSAEVIRRMNKTLGRAAVRRV